MKKTGVLIIATLVATSAAFWGCRKSTDNTQTTPTDGFDKTAMLTHYADYVVVPAYRTMQEKVSGLKTASAAFAATPSSATQSALLSAYKDAYLQYQRIAPFQFGPAETALLDVYLNYAGGLDYSFTTAGELTGFSVDTATIESNISVGSYNLATTSRSTLYSQGFGAIGYLCFTPNAITKMTGSTARAKYLNDLTGRMKDLVDGVVNNWSAYRTTFLGNTQTNVGSPIGNIVNQLAYQLDMTKGPRIGWPFGKQSNGTVFATKCEGYYAGISKELAVESLTALKNAYSGGSGQGIDDYLISLKKESLNTDVLAQFDAAIAKVQAIPGTLSAAFTASPTEVDAAYKEIQKLLTLLKTDVASATAVQITFTDNDGD